MMLLLGVSEVEMTKKGKASAANGVGQCWLFSMRTNMVGLKCGSWYIPIENRNKRVTLNMCSACVLRQYILFLQRYYSLDVSYFKSSLDRRLLELLWNKYWVNTLSSSSLLTVSAVAS